MARVLKAGGLYHVQGTIPIPRPSILTTMTPSGGYSSNSTYVDGEVDVVAIYGSDTWGVEGEDGAKIEVPGRASSGTR